MCGRQLRTELASEREQSHAASIAMRQLSESLEQSQQTILRASKRLHDSIVAAQPVAAVERAPVDAVHEAQLAAWRQRTEAIKHHEDSALLDRERRLYLQSQHGMHICHSIMISKMFGPYVVHTRLCAPILSVCVYMHVLVFVCVCVCVCTRACMLVFV